MPEERLVYADDFLDLFYVASAGQDKAFISAVEMVLKDTPTIDAVEVVRCADCTHGSVCRFEEDPEIVICTNKNMFPLRVSPGFYCAHGKREDVKE